MVNLPTLDPNESRFKFEVLKRITLECLDEYQTKVLNKYPCLEDFEKDVSMLKQFYKSLRFNKYKIEDPYDEMFLDFFMFRWQSIV